MKARGGMGCGLDMDIELGTSGEDDRLLASLGEGRGGNLFPISASLHISSRCGVAFFSHRRQQSDRVRIWK